MHVRHAYVVCYSKYLVMKTLQSSQIFLQRRGDRSQKSPPPFSSLPLSPPTKSCMLKGYLHLCEIECCK